MSFSDSDWTEAGAATAESKDHRVAVALATGVAIGAVAASLLWWLAATVRAPRPAPAPVAALAPATPAPRIAAEAAATPAATASPDAVLPTGPAAASAAAPDAPVAPAAAAASAVQLQQASLAEDAARRKERAWQKFYQPPTICAEDRRGEFLVECANHSIRARREFEQRYATGRL